MNQAFWKVLGRVEGRRLNTIRPLPSGSIVRSEPGYPGDKGVQQKRSRTRIKEEGSTTSVRWI